MGKNPCYGCNNRHTTCHCSCEAYLEFIEQNKKIKEERMKENELLSYYLKPKLRKKA